MRANVISVVIRYHEVALKRGNRSRFIAKLVANIKAATADLRVGTARARVGRIELPQEAFLSILRIGEGRE